MDALNRLSRLERRFSDASAASRSRMESSGTGLVERFRLFQNTGLAGRGPAGSGPAGRRRRRGRRDIQRTFTRQVSLLPSPGINSIANYAKLQKDGLQTKKITFQLDATREEFYRRLREEFPELERVTFRLCKVGPNKEVIRLEETLCTPRDIRNHQQHRRSNLYILPSEELPRNTENCESDEEVLVDLQSDHERAADHVEREVEHVEMVVDLESDHERAAEHMVVQEQTHAGDEEHPGATGNNHPGPGSEVQILKRTDDSVELDSDDLPEIALDAPVVSTGFPSSSQRTSTPLTPVAIDAPGPSRPRTTPSSPVAINAPCPSRARSAPLTPVTVCAPGPSRPSYLDHYIDMIESDDSDDELQQVLLCSMEETQEDRNDAALDGRLQTEVRQFREKYKAEGSISMLVRRKKLLKSTNEEMRRINFVMNKEPSVVFCNEEAVDLGGPRREFFSLLMKHLPEMGIFEGQPGRLYFSHDIVKLEEGTYELAGRYVAWSVLHDGPGFPGLHPAVYQSMFGTTISAQLEIEDVTDIDVREKLEKISLMTEETKERVVDELGDWSVECGCPMLYNMTSTEEAKQTIVQTLLKQHVVYRSKSEMNAFVCGLNYVGNLGNVFSEHTAAMAPLLTNTRVQALTFFTFRRLMRIEFSDSQLLKNKEEDTVYAFERFLHLAADSGCELLGHKVELPQVLRFITGADVMPPTGFEKPIDVRFFTPSEGSKGYPFASTCGLDLSLPRGVEDDEFSNLFMEAIICSPGFGKL